MVAGFPANAFTIANGYVLGADAVYGAGDPEPMYCSAVAGMCYLAPSHRLWVFIIGSGEPTYMNICVVRERTKYTTVAIFCTDWKYRSELQYCLMGI